MSPAEFKIFNMSEFEICDYSDVKSGTMTSQITDNFTVCQHIVGANNTGNTRTPHYQPFVLESTDAQWIPLTKGQKSGKCVMSWRQINRLADTDIHITDRVWKLENIRAQKCMSQIWTVFSYWSAFSWYITLWFFSDPATILLWHNFMRHRLTTAKLGECQQG